MRRLLAAAATLTAVTVATGSQPAVKMLKAKSDTLRTPLTAPGHTSTCAYWTALGC